MKKIIALLLVFLVVAVPLAISGCTQSTITSDEEATQVVKNVSTDVGEVGDLIADIENSLG